MGFTCRKAKRKPALTPKQKGTRLQWAKEKQPWNMVLRYENENLGWMDGQMTQKA